MASKTLSFRIFLHDQLVDTRAFTQDVIKVGRLASSHLRLDHEAIGRMHAVIEVGPQGIRLIDLGSTGGSSVNGQAIERSRELSSGDRLEFGPYRIELAIADAQPSIATELERASVRASAPMSSLPSVSSSVAPINADLGQVEDRSEQVAEVVATYGRSVLDVAHVGQTKSSKRSALPLLGLGGVLMLGGLGLFGYEVAQPWTEYSREAVEAQQARREVPPAPGLGTGGLGLALALLGLVPFVAGALRLRDESLDAYMIGEGPEARFKLAGNGLPSADATPLVERTQGGYALAFTPAMQGKVELGGQQVSLADLIASGRAQADAGMYRYNLPAGAKARVQHGEIGFSVSLVHRGAVVAGRSEVDWPFWAHFGGVSAIAGAFYLLMRSMPDDALAVQLADDASAERFASYFHQADEVEPVEPDEAEVIDSSEASEGGTPGKRAGGPEGQMGKPTAKSTHGAYQMKGMPGASPQISRNFDPEMQARQAGILGILAQQNGHFLASADGGAFAVGTDDQDIWGNLVGTEAAEAYGTAGLGLIGSGRGGGGNANGLIGMSNTGLLGHGPGSGNGLAYGPKTGDGGLTGFGKHEKKTPVAHVGQGTVKGGIDKDTVRRIVRAHINEVRSCYNAGLTRNPNLEGRVIVQFSIIGTGKVSTSVVQENTTKDESVGNCVAKAVKRWQFPKVANGGTALVSYPFRLTKG